MDGSVARELRGPIVASTTFVLSTTLQRWLKAVHVIAAGTWLGALAAIVWLYGSTPTQAGSRWSLAADMAAYTTHEVVLFWAFVSTLVTGLCFSLWTQWGFFRFHWLTLKWVLAAALFGVTLWLQSPAISGVVALSDVGVDAIGGHSYAAYRASSFRFAMLQLGIVVSVFVVSTLKPWGKRRGRVKDPPKRWVVWTIVGTGAASAALGIVGYLDLSRYRRMTVTGVSLAAVPDGTYAGRYDCGFEYAVTARVHDGRLEDVAVRSNRDVHYARIAEAVLTRARQEQRTDVDAITGATTTSKCLLKALESALSPPGI